MFKVRKDFMVKTGRGSDELFQFMFFLSKYPCFPLQLKSVSVWNSHLSLYVTPAIGQHQGATCDPKGGEAPKVMDEGTVKLNYVICRLNITPKGEKKQYFIL